MRHECTQMSRSKEIQTVIGQVAYGLYRVWLEKQRRKPPEIQTFLTSAYYSSFIKFAQWVRETGIGEPEKYVELMNEAKIAPALWRRSEAYKIYLEYWNNRATPTEQAIVTTETLLALADGVGCELKDVFKHFKVGEILELVQQRRLSPWLLFCSRAFKDWISSLHDADRTMFMNAIGINFWSAKFEKSSDAIVKLKGIAADLGI